MSAIMRRKEDAQNAKAKHNIRYFCSVFLVSVKNPNYICPQKLKVDHAPQLYYNVDLFVCILFIIIILTPLFT